jgi:monoterpene epsilon-lactone hydrolase
MLSIRARMINGALRLARKLGIGAKFDAVIDDEVALGDVLRRVRKYDVLVPPRSLRRRWTHRTETVDGSPLHVLQRSTSVGVRAVLYLHGGGYVLGPARVHWTSMAQFAEQAHADLAMLVYPKAPEHDHRAAIAAAVAAYELLERRYGAEHLVVAGDSAGGGLTASLLTVLRDRELPQPRDAVLISPWLDLSLSDPASREQAATDFMLTIPTIVGAGRYYAGSLETTDPLVSPRFASTHGLAPMHIFVGTDELFLADCRAFAARAKANGDVVTIRELEKGQHVSALFGTPEGRIARAQMLALVNWP